MKTLRLGEKDICSLAELRKSEDFTQLTSAFLDGSLEEWLADCYYEREADAVSRLDHVLSPTIEQKLYLILKMEQPTKNMTEEQREAYDRKCAVVRKYSSDNDALSHIMETATNQAELAEMLDSEFKTIYLCGEGFSVPIRKSGVHYIGIGNPGVETVFTEEQYQKAGITFEGLALPLNPDETAVHIAEQAAYENGYDDFADKHCRLATLLHNQIKGYRLFQTYSLNANTDIAGEFYKSKWAAETAAHKVIEKAYAEANSYFQPDRVGCIAPWAAEEYATIFKKGTKDIAAKLRSLAGDKADLAKSLCNLADGAQRELLKRFEKELKENSDFYEMYKKSYFMEQIEIEKHDFNLDLFDSEILNGLARMIHDDSEYTVEKLYETIGELEDDLNKHADTFFGCAYQEYKDYCREAEKIAEEIGKDLSDDDLMKLGLLEKGQCA